MTKSKIITGGLQDFCDREGNYIKTFSFKDLGTFYKYSTRASEVWDKIQSRCLENGWYQLKHKSYVGCSNNFHSFQVFAEWCQSQKGYWSKDSLSRYWALDKDILIKGNKIYSNNTCIFVPQYVNKLLADSLNIRGEFPIGVSLIKHTGNYSSFCKTRGNGEREYFGSFKTPESAHAAWQLGKIKAIENCILRCEKELDLDIRVVESLEARIIQLKQENSKGEITVSL